MCGVVYSRVCESDPSLYRRYLDVVADVARVFSPCCGVAGGDGCDKLLGDKDGHDSVANDGVCHRKLRIAEYSDSGDGDISGQGYDGWNKGESGGDLRMAFNGSGVLARVVSGVDFGLVGESSTTRTGGEADVDGEICTDGTGRAQGGGVACAEQLGNGQVKSSGTVLLGPNGGVSIGRGSNYEVNQAARERRKRKKRSDVCMEMPVEKVETEGVEKKAGSPVRFSHKRVTTQEEQDAMAREWYERKRVENRLAIQKAEYQFKRNEWLSKSRVSEKKWEEERLRCEEKLDALSKARLGHGPAGFAETVYSDGSVTPPSLSRGDSSPATLSDGTLSPDSSISVAELRRIEKKFAEMEEKNKSLELCVDSLKKLAFDSIKTQHGMREFDEVCGVNSAGFAGILKDGKRLFLGDPGFEMPITASNCGYTGSDVEF